jgi:hypothetical protein
MNAARGPCLRQVKEYVATCRNVATRGQDAKGCDKNSLRVFAYIGPFYRLRQVATLRRACAARSVATSPHPAITENSEKKMTDTTPTSAQPDDPTPELPIEILVQASPDGSQAWLVLAPIPDGDVLEIPISRADAMQLVAALAEYAWPGCRLMSAPAAGQA